MLNTIFGWETPWGRRKRERQERRIAALQRLTEQLHQEWKNYEASRVKLREQLYAQQAEEARQRRVNQAIADFESARYEHHRQQAIEGMRDARRIAPARSFYPPRVAQTQPVPEPIAVPINLDQPALLRAWHVEPEPERPVAFAGRGGGFDGGGASGNWTSSGDRDTCAASSSGDSGSSGGSCGSD